MIVIPNSKMGEAILTNYMRPYPYFRIDLNLFWITRFRQIEQYVFCWGQLNPLLMIRGF